MNTWWTFFISLWLSTFTEGLLLPTLIGMIINTVPQEERPTVYAVSLVLEKLLGMTLGPSLYGILVDEFPHFEEIDGKSVNTSRVGMYMLFWSSVIGLLSSLIVLVITPKFKQN